VTEIDGFVLGVDLGTSHTVAMLRHPDGRTRPLLFDGQPLMSSAVYLDTTGRLHVGADALRLGHAEPGRLEPNPKRYVDAGTLLLGGRAVPVADLFAALLGAVAREAVATTGLLPPAILTYPAAWGAPRRAVLTDALGKAGWPADTRLVPEPVAAARYFADVLRRPVPPAPRSRSSTSAAARSTWPWCATTVPAPAATRVLGDRVGRRRRSGRPRPRRGARRPPRQVAGRGRARGVAAAHRAGDAGRVAGQTAVLGRRARRQGDAVPRVVRARPGARRRARGAPDPRGARGGDRPAVGAGWPRPPR
jgi:hypothetical protein